VLVTRSVQCGGILVTDDSDFGIIDSVEIPDYLGSPITVSNYTNFDHKRIGLLLQLTNQLVALKKGEQKRGINMHPDQ
jgi:hypothetical protein